MSDQFEVKIVKLVGGIELVAKVPTAQFDEANQTPLLLLESPHYVMIQQQGQQVGIGLQPFSLVGDISAVAVSHQHVLAILTPEERFAQNYLATLAGLVTAGAGDVVPESARAERRGRLTLVD